ncbi:terpenoid synthase [Trametes polyzona]|nr:terpenoid synthase [Trametes polyzona]
MHRHILRLPDTLARWPRQRRINPLYEQVQGESTDWIRSFHPFTPDKQPILDKSACGLFASLIYPDADCHLLRAACDFMHMTLVFEEYTDDADETLAKQLADITIDAIKYPVRPRPAGESVIGEITRQFWSRAITRSTPSGRARFLFAWANFVESVVVQARDRDQTGFRTVNDFLEVRRHNIGAQPCYALAVLNEDLPLDVSDLPLVKDICRTITDMVILDNDLYSYAKERAAGDDKYNVIRLVMHETGVDVDMAVEWLAREHSQRMEEFFTLWPNVQALSFGSDAVNRGLATYLDHICNWPRGNTCWSFESGRYFGKDGGRVQLHRTIEIEDTREAREKSRLSSSISL